MRQLLLLAAAMLLVPAASAQTFEWVYDGDFPTDTDFQYNSTHGLAIDPDGKIWISPFSATDSVLVNEFVTGTDNGYRASRVLYVFNADGTVADISPIKFVEYADGTTPDDTLGGFINSTGAWEGRSGRGLSTDNDGNILASMFDTLFKLDYETGEGLAKAVPYGGNSITAASATPAGNVFIAPVVRTAGPITELDASDLSVLSTLESASGFNRSILALADGNTVISLDYTVDYSKVLTRPDAFTAFDSTFATFYGLDIESATRHPVSGNVWVSSGSQADTPNGVAAFETSWKSHTWYEFNPADLLTEAVPTPLDSLTWNGCTDFVEEVDGGDDIYGVCQDAPIPTIGKPRAIAFSPDGETAYVANFDQLAPSIQKFVRQEVVANEPTVLADGTLLRANAPNPFSGTTTIRFDLATASQVAVRVYDVMGREIATLVDDALAAGPQSTTFDAGNLAAGTYLYTLEVDGQRLARRMLVLR